MINNLKTPRRRNMRLPDWDYAQAGMYFVTICAHSRKCLFGEVVDGAMQCNAAGRMVARCWLEIPGHFARAELDAWVVMPNHVHGIVCIGPGPDAAMHVSRATHGARLAHTEGLAHGARTAHSEGPTHVERPTHADGLAHGTRTAHAERLAHGERMARADGTARADGMAQAERLARATVGATHASPLPTTSRPWTTTAVGGPRQDSIAAIVGSFKAAASRRINEHDATPGRPVWQRNYHEHIIRNEAALAGIRAYIVNNPQQWMQDRENPANTARDRR